MKISRKQKRNLRESLHSVNERQRHTTVNQAIQYLKATLPSKEPTNQDTKFMVLNRAVEYTDFLQRKVLELGRQRGKTVFFKDRYLCIEVPQKDLGSKTGGSARQVDMITPEILEELIKDIDEEEDDVGNVPGMCGKSVKDAQFIEYPRTPKREFGVVPGSTPETSFQSPCTDMFMSPSRGDQLLSISSSVPSTGLTLSPIIGSSQSTNASGSDHYYVTPEFSPNNFPYEHSYSRRALSDDRDIMELENSITLPNAAGCSSLPTTQATYERIDSGGKHVEVSETGKTKFTEEDHVRQGNPQQRKTSKKLQKTNCDPFQACHRVTNCKSSNCGMCKSPASKSTLYSTEAPTPPPPKSWINGYQLYTRLNYQIYKMKHPDLVGREVTKALGNAWRELPEEDRKHYSQQACELNEQRRVEREAIIMTQQKSRDLISS